VPFFLGGRNAWVEGIGEKLTPIDLPGQWLAVLKPPASIETRAIFASPLLARNTEAVIVAGFLAKTGIDALVEGFGRNDLEPAAKQQCAEVAQATKLLEARFGNSRMTGSGSAVFARAGKIDGTTARPMATLPADLPPGWVGRMCRSLEHHPLLGWCPG
jgi:4-diphosphocytidyl-2-C-methyl-D-erythritol kinase